MFRDSQHGAEVFYACIMNKFTCHFLHAADTEHIFHNYSHQHEFCLIGKEFSGIFQAGKPA